MALNDIRSVGTEKGGPRVDARLHTRGNPTGEKLSDERRTRPRRLRSRSELVYSPGGGGVQIAASM